MLKKIFSKFLVKIFRKKLNDFLEKNNYLVIYRNGSAIGEHVYMSSIIRKVNILEKKKILLFTNHHILYLNNPRVFKLFKIGKKSIFWFILKNLKGKSILEFQSIHATKINHFIKKKYFLYYHQKKIDLAQAMSEHFNMNIDYSDLKNEFFFSRNELINFEKELELPKKFSLIQSASKKTFTENKEWKIDGMQSIVNYFKNINWIQIGMSDEPILNNCKKYLDLDLRRLAFVIYKCDFLVTYEGLFNHLAACFEKKNFIIHTGFLHEEAFFYKNNIIIEKNREMSCYPCYSLDCKTHKKSCLSNITNEFVINKIEKNI